MKKIGLVIVSIGVLSILLVKLDKKDVVLENNNDVSNYIALYKSEDNNTYTEISEIPESGYKVNEDKSYCTTDNKTKVKGKVKTVNGKTVIANISKTDKCYVWFDKVEIKDEILKNITVKEGTPDFTQVATTDEGVYSVSDGMYGGTSYYWRGAVENNYLTFGGFCWRIVRINGDGTIRLIYDGTTCHANGTSTTESIAVTSQKYNTSYNRSEYVGYTYTEGIQRPTNNLTGTASNLKSQTDTWYNNNIGNNTTYSSKVADGKYCNDRDTASGYSWSSQTSSKFNYAGYDRSGVKASSTVTVTPALSCSSDDIYTLKAGAITMDEVIMAGAKFQTPNSNYYLYSNVYWTMSPAYWTGSFPDMFYVTYDGQLEYNGVSSSFGVRPVINLKSDITFNGGDGTLNNPFVVEV